MVWFLFVLGCAVEDPGAPPLEPICDAEAEAWSAGARAFSEATDDWGLTGVEGVRLLAVDFDGDGWTDLAVHRGGSNADDFSEGGVRQSWLLRNDEGQGFVDVTESSGFRTKRDGTLGRRGSVLAFADVDNDGDLDAYTGLNDPDKSFDDTSEILLNQGDGSFVLGPEESDHRRDVDVPSGAVFVDVDRDGFVDLWVPQGHVDGSPRQDRLYLGDGTGRFTDATRDLGLKSRRWSALDDLNQARSHTNAWSGAACDLNDDGRPELLAASYGRAPNHLWQAGEEGYANQSLTSGYAYDHRENWTDNESARCWCTLNPDDVECGSVPEPDLISCQSPDDAFRWNHTYDRDPFRLGGNSGATVCADVNNDGALDLLTTEIVHWDVGSSSDPSELLLNDGGEDVTFSRPGNDTTGLVRDHELVAWNDGDITASVFDFDNDGWPDIYLGSTDYEGARGLLYHQASPEQFVPVPLADGLDHPRSHGVAIADFDRDGDLDMVVGHSRNRCGGTDDCLETPQTRLFENQLGGNHVQLSLEGSDGVNGAAVGARVELTAGGVTQTKEIQGGYGHYGAQDDLTAHFGLGSACEAEVTVRWPDDEGTTESFSVLSGYRYQIRPGQAPAVISDTSG